jgi:hypothetical protein
VDLHFQTSFQYLVVNLVEAYFLVGHLVSTRLGLVVGLCIVDVLVVGLDLVLVDLYLVVGHLDVLVVVRLVFVLVVDLIHLVLLVVACCLHFSSPLHQLLEQPLTRHLQQCWLKYQGLFAILSVHFAWSLKLASMPFFSLLF